MSEERGSRTELRKRLRKHRVETVTAEYDGSGDSGQVGDPTFEPVGAFDGLATDVQHLFYELLEDLYGGWEINEGSFGQFVWNVSEDRITLLHTARIESTEEQDL
jgi:hypothetical protein